MSLKKNNIFAVFITNVSMELLPPFIRKIFFYGTLYFSRLLQDKNKNKNINLTLSISSVKSWCHNHQLPFFLLKEKEKVNVTKPSFFENEQHDLEITEGEAFLPEIYLAQINDATVIGGTELIITSNNQALYDEVALSEPNRYNPKCPYLTVINKNEIKIELTQETIQLPKSAILLCKDFSLNYFHWLIECLPKLWSVEQFPEYNSLPLLVDEKMPHQHLEALHLLDNQHRQLYFLKQGQSYKVDKLIYPSDLSIVHENTRFPMQHDKDVIISPLAINYLRENLLKKIPSYQQGYKKIFISRKNAQPQSRAILNIEEIESLFIQNGFQLIYPELLSFENQIAFFSQADVVAGIPGSAISNIIFMQPGKKVILFTYENPQLNYYVFDQIAKISNLDLHYVFGTEVITNPRLRAFSSFTIDKTKAKRALLTI